MFWPFKKKTKKTDEDKKTEEKDKGLIEETKEKIKTQTEKKKEALGKFEYLREKAGGGIIRKYKKGGLVAKKKFIARACGKVMNKRRKLTKIY